MSLNKIGVIAGVSLALLAALVGTPRRVDDQLNDIARLIQTEKDHITPIELAERIHSGKDIRLIDLRDSVSHFHQHIIDSELISVQQLLKDGIRRNEFTVLYSEGGIHASQVWILLKMKGCDSVYTLLGGFSGWKEEILHPRLPRGRTEEDQEDIERRRILSLFFGGRPIIIQDEKVNGDSIDHNESPLRKKPTLMPKKEELRFHC